MTHNGEVSTEIVVYADKNMELMGYTHPLSSLAGTIYGDLTPDEAYCLLNVCVQFHPPFHFESDEIIELLEEYHELIGNDVPDSYLVEHLINRFAKGKEEDG